MEKLFIAYMVKNGNIIEEGYDVIVKEICDNKYQELITGNIFENYRCSNDDLTVCLCYRIDSILQYKYINQYLRYQRENVKRVIENLKTKKIKMLS